MPNTDSTRDFLVAEFDKLKTEQTQRIGFRDNLLFVHLAATGAVASWVLANLSTKHAVHALLAIPWACIVLGWTYVVNDNHISRIGMYVRRVMNKRVSPLTQVVSVEVVEGDGNIFEISELFGWEAFHRIDKRRKSRKFFQWIIDEVTFCLPGALALLAYIYLSALSSDNWLVWLIIATEAFCLLGLGFVITLYADFESGK